MSSPLTNVVAVAFDDEGVLYGVTSYGHLVMIDLASDGPNGTDADAWVSAAAERGLRFLSMGPRRLRLVTHLDVSRADCERAVGIFTELARRLCR